MSKVLEPQIPKVKSKLISTLKTAKERVYAGYYRFRTSEPKVKSFVLVYEDGNPAPLQDAVLRFREHCDKMGYRFLCVRPSLVGLDDQEELKYRDPDYDPEELGER